MTTALSPAHQTVVQQVLSHRPGVLAVQANPVAQTATVTFDPEVTSVENLRGWVQECGMHCAGQSVPGHICDPLVAIDHGPHDPAAMQRADDAHGGGHGGHAGMSMDAMARDMRNRFLVALVFTIPIVLWSMVGTKLLGSELGTPFGIDRESLEHLNPLRRRAMKSTHMLLCAVLLVVGVVLLTTGVGASRSCRSSRAC